jgi:hypothetical protein
VKWAAVAVAVFSVAFGVTALVLGPGRTNNTCDKLCIHEVGVAHYLGFNELDCDGQADTPSGTCSDELQNVNVVPEASVRPGPHGGRVVTIRFALAGGMAPVTYTVEFDRAGRVTGQR